MIMKIQRVLERNGFVGNPVKGFPSSIIPGGVSTTYTRNGVEAVIGLGDVGIPPTLQYPRGVKLVIAGEGENMICTYSIMRDAEMVGWIAKATDEEIIDFIHNDGKPLIVIDLNKEGEEGDINEVMKAPFVIKIHH